MNGVQDSPEYKLVERIGQIVGLILFVLLLLWALACKDSGSPTEPGSKWGQKPDALLVTSHGTAAVYTLGNSFDLNRAVEAVEAGYNKAFSQVGGRVANLTIDGMTVFVHSEWSCGTGYGCYQVQFDTVNVTVGYENVLTHELQHRFAYALHGDGPCFRLQDHSPGFDLNCHAR